MNEGNKTKKHFSIFVVDLFHLKKSVFTFSFIDKFSCESLSISANPNDKKEKLDDIKKQLTTNGS